MAKIGVYSKKVMKHFHHPQNMGKIKNADGVGKVGNIVCGDVLWLYIKVNKNRRSQEIIKDISFETFGCVAAISTSSVITELAKGKTLDQALKISKNQVVKSLGSLPPVKLHCSVLAVDALAEAVYDYLAKNKRKIPGELEKRHQMIKKDKETINDRYHGWVELEEKLHQR